MISPKEPSPCPNSGVAELTPRHPLVSIACLGLEFIDHLPRVIKLLDRVLGKFNTLTEERTQRKENMAREIRFDNGELADVEDLVHFLNVLQQFNIFQPGDLAPLSTLHRQDPNIAVLLCHLYPTP